MCVCVCVCVCVHTHTYIYVYVYIFFFIGATAPSGARFSSLSRFLDHTQRRITVGRTPLDKWSAGRRDLYLTQHAQQTNIHAPVGFEPTISAGERPQTARPLGPAYIPLPSLRLRSRRGLNVPCRPKCSCCPFRKSIALYERNRSCLLPDVMKSFRKHICTCINAIQA